MKNVLIAEDVFQLTFRKWLGDIYHLEFVEDSLELEEALKSNTKYHAILLDYNLGCGTNTLQALDHLTGAEFNDVKIIIIHTNSIAMAKKVEKRVTELLEKAENSKTEVSRHSLSTLNFLPKRAEMLLEDAGVVP